ncbi:hypothetical protein [Streptomyces sp. RKCA744]|uniref:hypothetical protein n=1 Tax=Streptomyces sp. RKCA744 TaxID=2959340 RepID=UPI00209CD459|nr:hypothetical protein [Streptomyces sp. RKCA744]MCO8303628.1 hypothetical protein [Streptomyces sp. RKCA744]
MPTYEATPRFTADHRRLTPAQRRRFRQAVTAFIDGLHTGTFRASLRVKGVRSAPGVFELTWDGDGRATWSYGPEIVRGAPHIIWRRIGTHAILTGP